MTGNTIAEVYSPRERGGGAEGIVGKAREEAADTADGDTEAEGNGEEVAGPGMNVFEPLGYFHRDPATEKSTDDRLAAGKEDVSPSELGHGNLFEKAEKAQAEERSDGCGRDD